MKVSQERSACQKLKTKNNFQLIKNKSYEKNFLALSAILFLSALLIPDYKSTKK
jgi:hypothetical protein